MKLIQLFIRISIIIPYFYLARFFKDQIFLYKIKNPKLKPLLIFQPVYFLTRAAGYLKRIFQREFTNYAMKKYSNYILFHYSKNGRGYFAYENLTFDEKLELYGHPEGRITQFINDYTSILNYQDGDSFFDVGCGRGQNIKVLLEKYSNSFVHGIDISKEAIGIINLAVKSENLKLQNIDIKNTQALKKFKENSYDHIIMSHVFSLILNDGLSSTIKLRKTIISELVRIANISVIIIGGPEIVSKKNKFTIEQLHRGTFAESIINYFPSDAGIKLILNSPHSSAVLFKKRV